MIILIFLLLFGQLNGTIFNSFEQVPTLHQGRIKPLGTAIEQERLMGSELPFIPDMPVKPQLSRQSDDYALLPGRYSSGEWYSLNTLRLPINNFTAYSNEQFEAIRTQYLQLDDSLKQKEEEAARKSAAELSSLLLSSYRKLNSPQYPSYYILKTETLYNKIPFLTATMVLYGLSALLLLSKKRIGFWCLGATFLVHTLSLVLRSIILQRPPVANMAETIIYVPWVTILTSLVLYLLFKNRLILTAGAISSFLLLLILKLTFGNAPLDNIQPVLNSQYWLTIHVLLVVGSYGAFILGGALGHIYIVNTLLHQKTGSLNKLILQTLYIGTALLTIGTILGGIWAAQSWGRFWDWDPKESWAFISICTYLIWIHTYRFHYIGDFILALGAIIGLQAITFTWYGVNYILGTGFHSYGFGSGGETFYYLFLFLETVFIAASLFFYRRSLRGVN